MGRPCQGAHRRNHGRDDAAREPFCDGFGMMAGVVISGDTSLRYIDTIYLFSVERGGSACDRGHEYDGMRGIGPGR